MVFHFKINKRQTKYSTNKQSVLARFHHWPTFSTALLTGALLTSYLVKPKAVRLILPREAPLHYTQTETSITVTQSMIRDMTRSYNPALFAADEENAHISNILMWDAEMVPADREVNQIICPTQIPLVLVLIWGNELLMEQMRRHSELDSMHYITLWL